MPQIGKSLNGRLPATTADGLKPALPDKPAEDQIIAALAGRYDELEALWQQAEEDLKQFRIHRPVQLDKPYAEYEIYENGGPGEEQHLAYRRHGKGWHICHATYIDDDRRHDQRDEMDWTPISDCTVEVRVSAIRGFADLRKKVVEEAQQSVPRLDTALASFRAILKG